MMTCYMNRDGETNTHFVIMEYLDPDWLSDQIILDALKDIEGVVEINGFSFRTETWGWKSVEGLSGGMKALMIFPRVANLYYKEHGILLSNATMGDNCAKYLQRLSLKYDFPIAWDHFMWLDASEPLNAVDYDTGKEFHTRDELMSYYAGRLDFI